MNYNLYSLILTQSHPRHANSVTTADQLISKKSTSVSSFLCCARVRRACTRIGWLYDRGQGRLHGWHERIEDLSDDWRCRVVLQKSLQLAVVLPL